PRADEGWKVTAEPPVDPDGDAVRLTWTWTVDGAPVPAVKDRTAITPGEYRKGQKLAVEVVASDGEASGEPARIEVVARNTPPSAPVVALEPAQPTTETGLKVVIATAATDRDGDAVTYRYRW